MQLSYTRNRIPQLQDTIGYGIRSRQGTKCWLRELPAASALGRGHDGAVVVRDLGLGGVVPGGTA